MDPIKRTIDGMTFYSPSIRAREALEAMRLNFKTLVYRVDESPKSFGIELDGRCKAIVLTKLEEALMWASKGIVLSDSQSSEENDGSE